MLADKRRRLRVGAALLSIIVIFLGTVWCGMGRGGTLSYNAGFSSASDQCQGTNASPQAGEQVLTVAVVEGPNIILCLLRASDGTLLRHFTLAIHGDKLGQADGLLYINERGGTDGASLALCAVQVDNGVTRWCQTQIKDAHTITISAGTVYALSSETSTQMTTLSAVQPATGQIIWSTQSAIDPSSPWTQVPVLAGQGQVYLPVYQTPAEKIATTTPTATSIFQDEGTWNLCAFQTTNGHQNWCRPLPVGFIESLAVDDHDVYVRAKDEHGGENNTFIALRARSGELDWQTSFTSDNGHTFLAVVQGLLLTNMYDGKQTTQEKIVALHASNGSLLWQHSLHAAFMTMTIAGSHMYLVTAAASLQALNLADGSEQWSTTFLSLPQYGSIDDSSLLVGPASVYLAATSRSVASANVMAVRANSGKREWNDSNCDQGNTSASLGTTIPTQTSSDSGKCHWYYKDNYLKVSLQLLQLDA